MSSTKYTLDRIEDGYAVFLKYPNEKEHVIIAMSAIDKEVQEGDRVMIEEIGDTFHIEILKEETDQKKADILSLMDKLRKKNK
ncbi:hypothetical protein AEA09_01070 [Lysinibacillus contaminans]|uniref:Pyruvate kinase n=1 Tax=Lysinibacillus contaminans TaxID=1293441 RepID=A0ABR5K5A6_9BACI|nr:DUF3006 domain-containing protein [Lysinibacillus contaminans]KOS71612.1 hypothetical protein AEA09_01070 [Lysinibacillus contaminans]